MNTNEKIAGLRCAMKKSGVNAYIMPSNDPHMSEYVSEHWKSRAYFSGFTGSAGTLVITETESGLWTDGRYYIQAEKQLSDSEITLFRMGQKDVPTYIQYLEGSLSKGQTVGFDGRLFSASTVKTMKKTFRDKSIKLCTNLDLPTALWQERPAEQLTEIFIHDKQYTGESCKEKLGRVREKMKERNADGYVLTELASIAWLFNIRANDIAYNPMVISYAFISMSHAYLCTDLSRMPKEVLYELEIQGVTVIRYEGIEGILKGIFEPMRIMCHEGSINETLYNILEENPKVVILNEEDIVVKLKAIKNETEISNIEKAHIKDGCAMISFMVALDEKLRSGLPVTEYDLIALLKDARGCQTNNKGESFASIVAYKENAAMMHYATTKEKTKRLKQEGLLLIDSGGQYLEGTTDLTRTFALGPTTTEEKLHYTLTLKSHIAMARAIFMEGSTGGNLDILARKPMWEQGLDYKCGTGHGVGFFLGVHEGPHGIRMTSQVPLKSGMIVTNEPGVYIEGKHGIRIENILLVAEKSTTPHGRFYHFVNMTFFPIDTKPLLMKLLTREEIDWLNRYHQTVYEKLSPFLDGIKLKWLEANTRPVE